MVGTIRSLSLQMALAKRFSEVTCDITHISSLEENRIYPIERADRVKTRFVEAILLSIRDVAADRLCKVFLPQRQTAVSRTTMYWPSMTGLPSGIWFRRVDAPIRTRTNWLLSRHIFYLLFRWICPCLRSTLRSPISFSKTCGHCQKNSKMSLSVCGRQTPWGIAHLKPSGHT